MLRRHVTFLPFALLSFLIGTATVQLFRVDDSKVLTEPHIAETSEVNSGQTSEKLFEFPNDNCGPWTDEVPLRPLIKKWLRNEKIDDVPYCSKSAIEATGYNPSNLLPKLIDINDDGVDELAIRYGCSGTGNCSMDIYQRTAKSYRQIFRDRQMVSYFDKLEKLHAGFHDLQTRSHGSCCDGDQVIYRFNGRSYKPVSCAGYSYWDDVLVEKPDAEAKITKHFCRHDLDPL